MTNKNSEFQSRLGLFGGGFLETIGIIWLLIEFVSFFSSKFEESIHGRGAWVFLAACIGGVVYGFYRARPKTRIQQFVPSSDSVIEVAVADMFEQEGAYVVGTNTSFDTEISENLISNKSVQGQFTQKYFETVAELDQELATALQGLTHGVDESKQLGKREVYEIGTTAVVTPKQQVTYFLAFSHTSPRGVVSSSIADLRLAFSHLWETVGQTPGVDPIITPIVGGNYGRIPESKETLIREIVESYLEAVEKKRVANKLMICITKEDRDNIDFTSLEQYLKFVCRHVPGI